MRSPRGGSHSDVTSPSPSPASSRRVVGSSEVKSVHLTAVSVDSLNAAHASIIREVGWWWRKTGSGGKEIRGPTPATGVKASVDAFVVAHTNKINRWERGGRDGKWGVGEWEGDTIRPLLLYTHRECGCVYCCTHKRHRKWHAGAKDVGDVGSEHVALGT
eukprot:359483-Chlamydomonas_euryale.AAC.1